MSSLNFHNDQNLIDQIVLGNATAFEFFVRKYSDRVFFHTLSFIKQRELAEETTQDIFVHIWNKREKLREISYLDGYVFIVSKHFLLSVMRKQLREAAKASVAPFQVTQPGVAVELENRELGDLLEKAIDHLPEQKKQVFRLVHQEGLSQAEVGKLLGIATRTVRWNLVSALNGIRDFLGRYPSERLYFLIMFSGFF